MSNTSQSILLSLGWGYAIFVVISLATGMPKAWESEIYIPAGIPLMAAGAGVLGWIYPRQGGWRCGVWIAAGHALATVLVVLNRRMSLDAVPPLVILLIAMTIPSVIVAAGFAFLKLQKEKDDRKSGK